jgi:CRISP-associated protein Cas1
VRVEDELHGIVRNGVIVLSGPAASVTVQSMHLVLKDGLRDAPIERRFARATCPVSRVIITGLHGYVSTVAMHWLDAIGATLAVLDYDGRPIAASVPHRNVRHGARLRRRQARLDIANGRGAEIARELIEAKIAGQIALLRGLDRAAADRAVVFAAALPAAGSGRSALLGIEGRVSGIYWRACEDWPVAFAQREPVPGYWRTFGARRSVLTGRPKSAINPANAILNYVYNVALSEIVIALQAAGFDPTMGILHGDVKDERASAAYDLLEPVRPIVDQWLLAWLREATFSRRDFFEDGRGAVRMMPPLPSHLAMTSALWREPAATVVAWYVRRIEGKRSRLRLRPSVEAGRGRPATRWTPGRWIARVVPPLCANCGRALVGRKRKFCGEDCISEYYNARGIKTGPAVIASAVARAARKSQSIDANQGSL